MSHPLGESVKMGVEMPHVSWISAAFFDRKYRFILYVTAYERRAAISVAKTLEKNGIKVHYIVKYQGKTINYDKLKAPYVVYLTPHRVLLDLHKRWWKNPRIIYRRKKK